MAKINYLHLVIYTLLAFQAAYTTKKSAKRKTEFVGSMVGICPL